MKAKAKTCPECGDVLPPRESLCGLCAGWEARRQPAEAKREASCQISEAVEAKLRGLLEQGWGGAQ